MKAYKLPDGKITSEGNRPGAIELPVLGTTMNEPRKVWVVLMHFPNKPTPDVEMVLSNHTLQEAKGVVQKELALPARKVEWVDSRNYSVSFPMAPTHWFSIHESIMKGSQC